MIRAVIDTSVWIAGIFWHGPAHRVLLAWRQGEFHIVLSPPLWDELTRKLKVKTAEFHADPDIAAEWLDVIATVAVIVRPTEAVHVCRDPQDDMLLEAAMAGRARYVVSLDRDLTDLCSFQAVQILPPAVFLEVLADLQAPGTTLRERLPSYVFQPVI
jgi:putative PIN family toxin of toxin-antitoxin system